MTIDCTRAVGVRRAEGPCRRRRRWPPGRRRPAGRRRPTRSSGRARPPAGPDSRGGGGQRSSSWARRSSWSLGSSSALDLPSVARRRPWSPAPSVVGAADSTPSRAAVVAEVRPASPIPDPAIRSRRPARARTATTRFVLPTMTVDCTTGDRQPGAAWITPGAGSRYIATPAATATNRATTATRRHDAAVEPERCVRRDQGAERRRPAAGTARRPARGRRAARSA